MTSFNSLIFVFVLGKWAKSTAKLFAFLSIALCFTHSTDFNWFSHEVLFCFTAKLFRLKLAIHTSYTHFWMKAHKTKQKIKNNYYFYRICVVYEVAFVVVKTNWTNTMYFAPLKKKANVNKWPFFAFVVCFALIFLNICLFWPERFTELHLQYFLFSIIISLFYNFILFHTRAQSNPCKFQHFSFFFSLRNQTELKTVLQRTNDWKIPAGIGDSTPPRASKYIVHTIVAEQHSPYPLWSNNKMNDKQMYRIHLDENQQNIHLANAVN